MINKDTAYIAFLLGADNFGIISTKLAEYGEDFGMDAEFDLCVQIAEKFIEYDNNSNYYYPQYETLLDFLEEYENDILRLILDEKDFNIIIKEMLD